jgi:uncharacterized protein (TIGR03437 family)
MGRTGGLVPALLLIAALAAAQQQIRLIKVAGGFANPVFIASAGDGSNRLFVVEQAGRIRILRNGVVAATPFLDITSRVLCCGEQGLLSVAFPPDYATSGQFYVYYVDRLSYVVIARYRVGASPDVANPVSESVLLRINHAFAPNHNGGQLAFGPDGYLYIGTGDGGGGGDPLGNGQNPSTLLGKLLRIDVRAPTYTTPASNPMVNQPGARPEIWAYGLRNPWRFSFDRSTGALYIADVGQGLYEEVDFQPAGDPGGENYGWNIMEGFHCYAQAGCNQSGLTLPVTEYPHSGGDCSVTGGYVYRGGRYVSLQGVYLYADYCTGRIRGLTRNGVVWRSDLLLTPGFLISTFGQDEAGELYLANYGSGEIYAIAGGAPSFTAGGVVNAASYEPGLVPGSIATVFGAGLDAATGVLQSGSPLGTALLGTTVRVNGVAAPLYAVARANGLDQVVFQVPYETPAGGKVQVVVTNNGVESAPIGVDVLPAQPAVFTSDGVHAAGSPVAPGNVAVLWITGLGAVDNWPGDGVLAPIVPLARTVSTPQVTIAGRDTVVEYSGLAPLFAGLYQVNTRLPAGVPPGNQDVVVTLAGRSSQPVKITVTANP